MKTSSTVIIGFIIVIMLMMVENSQKEAIDFTYAEHEVEYHISQASSSIRLYPQSSNLDKYQFPYAWEISEFLSASIQQEQPLPQMINFNQQIQSIKQKAAQYLKLSNKAELLVSSIKQLPHMKNDPTLVVREEQFAAIEKHQDKLRQLNDEINNKGVQLEKVVKQLMIQQENPLFKQAELNFEKKALTQKISLLNDLLDEANSEQHAEERKLNQERLNEYFNELNEIFASQNGLIDSIDTLLKNHNELTILKARVASLTSQLKAHDLTLAEKQQCYNEYQKIKNKQRHDKQIFKLIQTLKEKKHEFNQPNKYCEGVENKLIDRIKKLLIGYDYVYECAYELDHVKENRDRVKGELEVAQRKLDQLQLSRGVEEFRRFFESNRTVIATKIQQLKTLQLDEFYRYPNSINAAILDAEFKIAQIDNTLDNLPSKSISNLNEIQNLIKQKVNQIQELKEEYCRVDQLYNKQAEQIDKKITKMEQQQEYNSWIKNVEVEKVQQLEGVKLLMKQIERELLEELI